MLRQFIDHPLPIDLALGSVVEDVEPDEPAQQVVECGIRGCRYRRPLLNEGPKFLVSQAGQGM
ncbi:MAG: hypothetical protein KJS79_15010 [Rhodospirillales bacterium]|uniref:hypothetical protein n=1 Tax=Acidiphilium sp. TaxID=527 RepID=UPI00258941C2|nr:hypothetical protein [Acidiphilium sp.]MBU6358019.1 hypothetical protein [Rhodospirillales bacterium]